MHFSEKSRWAVVATALCVLIIWWLSLGSGYERPSHIFGDLGGVKVELPQDYAKFVAFNEGETTGSRVINGREVNQAIFRSIGFEVRFPDMAPESQKTKADQDIFSTMWMRVGITAGDSYGQSGGNFLEAHLNHYLVNDRPCASKCFIYVPMKDATYGLTGYTPTGSGVDVAKRSVNYGRGTDLRDRNIYISRDSDGKVVTLIECGNRAHEAVRCQQYFNLEPGMRAHVRVNYRKSLLPEWRQIQSSVIELIHGFEIGAPQSKQSK